MKYLLVSSNNIPLALFVNVQNKFFFHLDKTYKQFFDPFVLNKKKKEYEKMNK